MKSLLAVLVLVGASSQASMAQEVYVQPIQIDQNVFAPPARNIAPGTSNNILTVLSVNPTMPEATLNSISVTTAGSYQLSDIATNGFKLWFTSGQSFDPSSVARATLIGQRAVVASGNALVFSGLSQASNSMDGGFYYITVDLAPGATLGRTISLTSTPFNNIVFNGAVTRGQGSSLPATSVQTIGTPLANIQVYSYSYDNSRISPGSSNNDIYEFQIYLSEGNTELRSLRIPLTGTFTSADVVSTGFKLYAEGDHTNYREELVATGTLNANREVVFSNLTYPLVRDREYGYYYFRLTVDLAPGATVGRTIKVTEVPLSYLTFGPTSRISGQLSEGAWHTVALPTVAVSSEGPMAGTVSPGSFNNLVYKMKATTANANAAFTRVNFTTGGTFQVSDIERFKLFAGEDDGYSSEDLIGTATAVSSGGTITFNLTNAKVDERDPAYVYLVADLAPGAVAGRTIQIQAPTAANFVLASGSLTVNATAGGVQTIRIPAVTFTPGGPAAGVISPGSFALLHSTRVSVTEAPATLTGVSYQLSGTYQPSDFGMPFGTAGMIEGIYLVYHKTPNLMEELEYYDDEGGPFLLNIRPTPLPNPGGTLSFTLTANDLASNSELNPSLPVGVGYITLLAHVSETAVLGRTIQASTAGIANFTLTSGTKTGTTGNGGLQTIGKASVVISAVPTPAKSVSTGNPAVVVYGFKADVTSAVAILQEITVRTAGTYQQSDIYGFELYASTDATFNYRQDNYLGYKSFVGSGNLLKFDDLDSEEVRAGTSMYYFIVAIGSGEAQAGRTIQVESVPASAFKYLAADITGNFPLAAGGVQTFINPTVSVSSPGVTVQNIAAGTRQNVIHRFNVTAAGVDAYLTGIRSITSGTYQFEDLSERGFNLWYNSTNSFAGSRLVTNLGQIGPNSDNDYGMNPEMIAAGTTGYFFITADLAPTAVRDRTIRYEIAGLRFGSVNATLSSNRVSPAHMIASAVATPTLAVSFPTVPTAVLQPGSVDNIIYRFNVAASSANATLNYIEIDLEGNFSTEDLASNGVKLWYNTTNTFAGSTLVNSFNITGDSDDFSAAINNVQINNGSTGYFFITASIAPNARANRSMRVYGIEELGFVAGNASFNSTTGAVFTINSALSAGSELLASSQINVFPNPYTQQGVLTISTGNSQPKLVTVYGLAGKAIATQEIKDSGELQLPQLAGGLYLIKVRNLKTNQTEVRKLLVQ